MNYLRQETIDEVLELGYSIIPNVLPFEMATDLRERLARLVELQRKTATAESQVDDYMVHNPMVLDSAFLKLLEFPAIAEILDYFLSDTSILYAFTTSSMPAGGSNFSNRIHVDSPRVIPNYLLQIGIIMALDDFTEENGATYILPGSFERTDAPSEEEFFSKSIRLLPKKGDFIVLNPRTWHLGGKNNTNTDRHAVTLSACRSYMRQRFDYPRMINEDVAKDLSPVLRRLLGFNVRVPTSLEEYYLPVEQRLYKPNQG